MTKETSMDKYKIKFESPSVEDFLMLRRKAGWGEMDVKLATTSLENSLFHVIILEGSHLIGIGRVIGDGAMYFYIQDVIVDPHYQRAGIGSLLMKHIEDYLSEYATKGSTITLLAAKGKECFYARYGYISRPNVSLGNGMCKFI